MRKPNEKPPEGPSIVRELLCWQLLAAIVCSSAFAYTVVLPLKIPKLNVPAVDTPSQGASGKPEAAAPDIDSDAIFAKIDAADAMVLFKKGEKDKAIQAALAIGKDRKKRKDPVQLLAAGTVLLASASPQQKWKANVLLDKANKIAPKSRYVKLIRARRLYDQGRMADAIAEYEACLNLSPDDWVTPRLELANLFMMNEEGGKAIEMFNEVLQLKPDDPRILKRLGITMAVNGDPKGGFDKFVAGSNREYDTPDYYPGIQQLLDEHAGLPESAVAQAREDVDKTPNDIRKRITLARLLISLNRLKQAKDQLDEAAKRLETDPEIHEVLAECFHRMKDKDKSMDEFTTTARLEPLKKPAAPPDMKYLPTWEDLHEEEELEKETNKMAEI